MALVRDYSKVANPEALYVRGKEDGKGGWVTEPNGKDKSLLPFVEAVTEAMRIAGVRSIEAENVDAIFTRLRMVERFLGTERYDVDVDGMTVCQFVTLAELKRLAGLETNIGPLDDAAFEAKIMVDLKASVALDLAAQKALDVDPLPADTAPA